MTREDRWGKSIIKSLFKYLSLSATLPTSKITENEEMIVAVNAIYAIA